MAQTLLQMCNHVADACGIARPGSVIGSSTDTARIMLASAQDEGESLTRRSPTGWVDLVREHAFQTTGITGETTFIIVNGLIDNTDVSFLSDGIEVGSIVVNTTTGATSTVVSVESNEYIMLADDIFTGFSGDGYRIFVNWESLPDDYKYLVDDTLWDRNNYWEMRGPLNPRQWQIYKSSVLGDTATTRRRWRIANINGGGKRFYIDPTPTSVDDLVFEYMSNGWCQSDGGTPQAEWLKDDDTVVLDEFLFRLGLKWRVLNRLGLDYLEEKDEYETEVENAIGRDTGGDELSLTGPSPISLLTTCNVADTGFGS